MTDFDVAIIGCGPTGAFLANLLGARGVRVGVLEKLPAPYELPRAVHFDGEAMRLLQSAGLAEAVLPLTHVNPGMKFKDSAGRVLVDWSRDMSIGPMGWHESYRFHQPDLERVLRAGMRRYTNVSLHEGNAVTDLRQDAGGVALETDRGPIHARYVVACDGAASPVRTWLGVGLEDLGFQERWLVVDLGLTRERPDLGDYSIQFCDPEAPATYVRGVGARRRFEMRISESDPDAFEDSEIWERLARWITPHDAKLERAAVYTFRSRLAEQWQVSRVFLAGDAAHQMPPFMGQGMCAGLRDAGNLAWKLAAVCGGADPDILTTYQSERAPNARAFIGLSADLGRLINQTAAGNVPEGRMSSIWPGLGPGLGACAGVVGQLVPQVDRADDRSRTGCYALVREPAGSGMEEVVGGVEWLEGKGVFGVIVRPDGYALAAAADKAGFKLEVERFAPLIAGVPPRRVANGLPEFQAS